MLNLYFLSRSVDYQSMLKEISTEQKFEVTYVKVGSYY